MGSRLMGARHMKVGKIRRGTRARLHDAASWPAYTVWVLAEPNTIRSNPDAQVYASNYN